MTDELRTPDEWRAYRERIADLGRRAERLTLLDAVRRLKSRLDDALANGQWDADVEAMIDLAEQLGAAAHAAKRRHRADRVLVLARCGHWWIEHRPANFVVRPGEPRVCSQCRPDAPSAVAMSPQGLAMVPVTYIDQWNGEPK